MKMLIGVLLSCMLMSCAAATAIEAGKTSGDDLLLSYYRGPCDGQCPVFRVELSRSGLLTYEGITFVAVEGVKTTQLDAEHLNEIIQLLKTEMVLKRFPQKCEYASFGEVLTTVLFVDEHYGFNSRIDLNCDTDLVHDADMALMHLEKLLPVWRWVGTN